MNYKFPKIRLGLCCINILLKYNEKVYASRKKTMALITKKGIDDAINSAKENVIDLAKMLLWNKNHGIEVMRVSSELVPHATNPEIIKQFGKAGEEYSKFEFLRPYLTKVGHIANLEKMRLTAHPGQFVQVASPSEKVFNASVKELEMHVKFFEMMELPRFSNS